MLDLKKAVTEQERDALLGEGYHVQSRVTGDVRSEPRDYWWMAKEVEDLSPPPVEESPKPQGKKRRGNKSMEKLDDTTNKDTADVGGPSSGDSLEEDE